MIRKLFLIAIWLPLTCSAIAQKKFEFNINCQRAYYDMMSMHFKSADSLLLIEKLQRPDNLIPYFVDDYKDFFTLAFNEDPTEINEHESDKDNRIQILSSGPKNSPYYLYTQAEVLLHWSFIHIANEQYTTGFFELRRAYHLLEENDQRFPDFIANKKFIGFIHSIVGTIPDNYKWAASFLGLRGTVPQGIAEVKSVMDYAQTHPFLFEDETRYIYIFMQLWLQNDVNAAWQLTEDAEYPSLNGNPLSTYVKGFMATKMNKNDLAITLFSARNFGSDVFTPLFANYMLGVSKLRRLDDDAHIPLEKFTSQFKGTNYLKDAYRMIAWNYLLNGDETNYHYFLSFCKTKGKLFTDADKDALEELNSGIVPNTFLLQVRLLTDGAYFDRALQLMQTKTESDFTSEKDKLEYYYRYARLLDESGNKDNSIPYYLTTVNRGVKLPYYFADNAALQLALIYEGKKDFDRAKYYYQKCLDMPDNVYKTSIDQKAKAGLNRLNVH